MPPLYITIGEKPDCMSSGNSWRKEFFYFPHEKNRRKRTILKNKFYICITKVAAVAQLVEHQLPKLRVTGSSPACRSSVFKANILIVKSISLYFLYFVHLQTYKKVACPTTYFYLPNRMHHKEKQGEKSTHGFSPCFSLCKCDILLRVHTHQELFVVFCLLQTVFHEIHCFDRIHVRQVFAEDPHTVERSLIKQQVVATST